MSEKETHNKKIELLCNICSNMPLVGVEFSDNAKNISESIKINYFCIYNHDDKKII